MPQCLLAAVVSGILYVLSFPSFGRWEIAWVALTPLIGSLIQEDNHHPFCTGWVAGFIGKTGLLYWIALAAYKDHMGLVPSLINLIGLSAFLSLYWGLWAYGIRRISSGSIFFPLFSASLWVLSEYAMGHLLTGFPWGILGASQWKQIALLQTASVTGVYGLSFLIVYISTLFAQGYRQWKAETDRKRFLRSCAWAFGTLLCILLAGQWRIAHWDHLAPKCKGIRISALQLNIGQHKKFYSAYRPEIIQTIDRLSTKASAFRPDMAIYPETSLPLMLIDDEYAKPNRFLMMVQHVQTTAVVGAARRHGIRFFNGAYLVNSEGTAVSAYTKHRLIPYAEHVPIDSWLNHLFHVSPRMGRYDRGDGTTVMNAPLGTFGISICYEAIFPDFIRHSVYEGASFLVNISNDGLYRGTAGIPQHFALACLRTVENGRWMIRSDNVGVTALIDPLGRVSAALPTETEEVLNGTLYALTTQTPYTRHGDWFVVVCLLFTLVGFFGALIPKERHR